MRTSSLPASKPSRSMSSARCPVKRSSISKDAPARPPRFMDPMTTLFSSTPSRSRSSRMSAVASTPSTPGRDSATHRRSSRSARSAMASGRSPVPSAPRAGWSAATIISRPLSPISGRRARRAAASATASGCRARTVVRSGMLSFKEVLRSGLARPVCRVRHRGPREEEATSGGVGMADEQARREATRAPAALAWRMVRSRSQPASRPWQSEPPKASPNAEAVDHLDRHRGTSARVPSRCTASTPRGPA